MMSKRLFCRAMREDVRHKIWMLVFFTMVSFLAVPMSWLLVRSNLEIDWTKVHSSVRETEIAVKEALYFFLQYLMPVGGIIALMSGLVAGLSAFGYVFHKNKVDTFHSLPIKRSMLYGVCYINGILVWLLPFLTCILLTLLLAAGFMGRLGGVSAVIQMCGMTGLSLLAILTIFLMVYHLVIVAVMVSGNILNTLVNILFLGVGPICFYAIWRGFYEFYMWTFYNYKIDVWGTAMAGISPLISAFQLAFSTNQAYSQKGVWNLMWIIAINLGAVVALGICGWILYLKRDSELAEQGVRFKTFTAILRTVCGVAAGMGGWGIFTMVTDNVGGIVGVAWKSFGAILVSVFLFGLLDVIFHMEFGAFLTHKRHMAVTVFVTLIICFAFYRDWFGYDTYLPEKEEIAQLAVMDSQFMNRNSNYNKMTSEILEQMEIQDVEAIYRYLESAVTGEKNGSNYWECETVETKVTLKNGRSYYREYHHVPSSEEILWPLFSNEEYLKYAYFIEEEAMEELKGFELYREGERLSLSNERLAVQIARAYNQDVLEHKEEVLAGEGQLLVRIWLERENDAIKNPSSIDYSLEIYSYMEHVAEVIRQAGYGEWVSEREAASISDIRIGLCVQLDGTETEEELIALAMKVFGVQEEQETSGQMITEGIMAETMAAEGIGGDRFMVPLEDEASSVLRITHRAEIEELLPYLNYTTGESSSPLRKQYVRVLVGGVDGKVSECYIQKGVLPMKYILRFGDIAREEEAQGSVGE